MKTKGTDQLHGSHTADLHFWFLICKKQQGFFLLSAITLRSIIDEHTGMSLVVRKPAFCICENKDADQLRGNREAD